MHIQRIQTRLPQPLVAFFEKQVLVPETAETRVSVMIQHVALTPHIAVIMLPMLTQDYLATQEIVSFKCVINHYLFLLDLVAQFRI